MENENKNENKGKYRTHRHKPYFISPNTPQNQENNAPKEVSATPTPDFKSKNKNKNKNRNQNFHKAEQTATPQTTVTQAPAEINNNANGNKQQNFDKSKRNKNKNKKNFDNSQKDAFNNRSDIVDNDKENDINDKDELDLSFPKFDRLEKPAPKKLETFSSSPEYQKYRDYEEFTYDQIYGSLDEDNNDKAEKTEKIEKNEKSEENADNANASKDTDAEIFVDGIQEEKVDALVEVVGIRFKSSGKTYYFTPNNINLRMGIHAVVETARGLEYGEVVMANTFIHESEIVPPLRPVVRAATPEDELHNKEIKQLEDSAFHICNEKIIEHGLDMKLIDAQYTFDNTKLLFYFTSSGRVDFRELVKDLASVFRTRIELRQIGIRDEAKMVGGLGICGRPLCCSKFLTDFGQVSIKMAKEQNLSLNTTKISGICGRLMCCLRYEHETYEYEIKRTPPVDTLVRTVDGVGTVTDISPLQGTIKVRLAASPEVMPKSYKREDVTILKKKN